MLSQEEAVARVVGAFICAIITGAFASYKNRSAIGWGIAGFFSFIIAFIILLFLGKKRNPDAEQIKDYVD
jgi:cytosine/uracil/thiamine/allantoin permease